MKIPFGTRAAAPVAVATILVLALPPDASASPQRHGGPIDASAINAVGFDGPDFLGGEPSLLRVSDRRIVRLFVSVINERTHTPEASGSALDTITLIPGRHSHRTRWEHDFSPVSAQYGFGPKFTAALRQLERYRTTLVKRIVGARASRVQAIILSVTTDRTQNVTDPAAIKKIVTWLDAPATSFTSYTTLVPSITVTLHSRGDRDASFRYYFTRPLTGQTADPIERGYHHLTGH